MRVPKRPKLYHITHGANLGAIIKTGGLLADSEAAQGRAPTRVGMSEVVARRKHLPVSYHPKTCVGDYVRIYFCPAISDAVPDLTPQPSEPVRDTPGQVPIVHLEGRPARGRGVGEWRAGALGLHLWECRREPRGVPIETCRPEGGELDGGSCGSVERRSEGPEAGGVSGASTPSLVAHREDRRDERALGETGVRNHWRHGSRSCRSTPPVVIFGMEPER